MQERGNLSVYPLILLRPDPAALISPTDSALALNQKNIDFHHQVLWQLEQSQGEDKKTEPMWTTGEINAGRAENESF